jgi:predicted amidohydrolase YtcJ|tara:strand:+ start:10 stop:444 length:435 start_codon:yes stop_codon:yes gene_type:complete
MTKKLELTSQISSDIEKMLMNGMPLTQICEKPGSPSLSKVYDWIRNDKEFADKIILSRRIAAQTYLDRMITELQNADNKNIMVIREKLHHYRWMASKLIGIYGDKQQVNVDQKIEITWNADGEDKSYENEIKNVSELGSLQTQT